jgi:adenylosuccinate lyase
MDDIMKPENFTGRSAQQVEEFVNEFVKPILDENRDILNEKYEMKN